MALTTGEIDAAVPVAGKPDRARTNAAMKQLVTDVAPATYISIAQAQALAAASPGGAALALSEVTPYVNRTTTGTAFSGACELAGYDCTVAAGNITIYDNTSAAGTVIVPTTALSVGRVEFAYKRALTLGCHVVLSGAATVNVLVGA